MTAVALTSCRASHLELAAGGELIPQPDQPTPVERDVALRLSRRG